MKEFVISEVKAETAVLVGLITKEQDEAKTKEYLDELEFLADTAGAVTVKRFTQKVVAPNQTTYVGKGKLEEIKQYIKEEEEEDREIGMVIFDDELSAKQIRNIEQELQVKILDRTSLILDIFAMRAQTAAAKTQVELAQYRYMLPRLQRLWTHLERQGGGSGSGGGKGSVGLRGPGETQLEMDRRIILGRMSLLKERLAEIDKQKTTQRKNRGRLIRVALVGYTNVGKSTIMNLLSKSEVFAENKLFATLDTTVRKVVVENLPFLLADTVGFIRKLPTDLVDSFKSTLDETREADLLLHVVDISHPDFEEQIQVVEKTLKELGDKVSADDKAKIEEQVAELRKLMEEGDGKLQLFDDMKWLVSRTASFFEDFGDRIAYPPRPQPFSGNTLLSKRFEDMTDDQKNAVKMSLTAPLSYVWGVPGSGKTQYVLARAINECVSRGERVAVIAPTNLSLEQVLYGLMNAFEKNENSSIDAQKDVVRIGNPTAAFMRYASICENRKIQAELLDKKAKVAFYSAVLCERRYDSIRSEVESALKFIKQNPETKKTSEKLCELLEPLKTAMSRDPRFKANTFRMDVGHIYDVAGPNYEMIYGRDRSRYLTEELASRSDEELESKVKTLGEDIDRLLASDPKADINKCKVVAMTLSKFIVSYGPEQSGGRHPLQVDHIGRILQRGPDHVPVHDGRTDNNARRPYAAAAGVRDRQRDAGEEAGRGGAYVRFPVGDVRPLRGFPVRGIPAKDHAAVQR